MKLPDRFHLVEFLVRGAKSEIYLVFDRLKQVHRILKFYAEDLQEEAKNEIVNRLQKIRHLLHPAVLPIEEIETTSSLMVFFPFIRGGTLGRRLQKEHLSFHEGGQFLAQMASVLDYLHGLGIVHRDIKPDNILLDEHNNLYLTDFDIAYFPQGRFSRYLLSTEFLNSGTTDYMAPEHLKGGRPSPAMDVYSTAVTLYQALSKNLPHGDDPRSRFDLKNYKPIPSLTRPQNKAIAKALHPDPAKRTAKVGQLYHELYT